MHLERLGDLPKAHRWNFCFVLSYFFFKSSPFHCQGSGQQKPGESLSECLFQDELRSPLSRQHLSGDSDSQTGCPVGLA